MKKTVKMVFIPIVGVIAIALIFMLVLWGASWYDDVVNDVSRPQDGDPALAGYAILGPTWECDSSYFPVCGMNGGTYDNACKAASAGTTVAYRGVCQE